MASRTPPPRTDRGPHEEPKAVELPPAADALNLEIKKRILRRTQSGAIIRTEQILEELRKSSIPPKDEEEEPKKE